jgi:hypothetical protein
MTTLAQQADAAYQRLWNAWIDDQLPAAYFNDLEVFSFAIDKLKELETQQ